MRDHNNPPEPVDDVEEAPAASAADIAKVIAAAQEQKRIQNKVERLTADLKEAKAELELSKKDTLLKAMEGARLPQCPLGNGWTVVVDEIVTASVPSPHSEKAENAEERNRVGIAYCDECCPDLVKNKVTAYFPKGLEKLFQKFLRDLNKRKVQVEYTTERTVHSGTLGKWVRDQFKLGKSVDEVALGVQRIKVAEVVGPPKSKEKV